MKPNDPISTSIPYYQVRSPGWEALEVFEDQKDAYNCAFDLSIKYPNTDFLVIKKVNWEEEVLFKVNLNLTCGLENIQEFYKAMIANFQEKLTGTIGWRRDDGR